MKANKLGIIKWHRDGSYHFSDKATTAEDLITAVEDRLTEIRKSFGDIMFMASDGQWYKCTLEANCYPIELKAMPELSHTQQKTLF